MHMIPKTCNDLIQLLPWYVNGSLEVEERRRAAEHLHRCDQCTRELEETRAAIALFTQHLPIDVLLDLAAGQSPAGFSEGVAQLHLDTCSRCTEELELAQSSHEEMTAIEEPAADVVQPSLPLRRAAPVWPMLTMAASLIAAIGLGGWYWTFQLLGQSQGLVANREIVAEPSEPVPVQPAPDPELLARVHSLEGENQLLRDSQDQLRGSLDQTRNESQQMSARLTRLNGPHLNAPVVDLFPGNLVLRSPDGGRGAYEATIPASSETVTLILNSRLDFTEQVSVCALFDADGREVWRREGLRRNPTGDFTVTLLGGDLTPGAYVLKLFGNRIPESLEDFPLRVE